MFDVNRLLDDAKEKLGTKSDRALARYIGVVPQAVNFYRLRGGLPSPDTAVRLARLAGQDPEKVVADLLVAQYKGDDPDTLRILRSIRDRISKGAAAALAFIVIALTLSSPSAEARTHREQITPAATGFVYYGKLIAGLRKALAIVGRVFVPALSQPA